MEIKYEGMLPDGTVYQIELQHEDKATYEKRAEALQSKRAEDVVIKGLVSILRGIEDLDRKDMTGRFTNVGVTLLDEVDREVGEEILFRMEEGKLIREGKPVEKEDEKYEIKPAKKNP